MKLQMVGCSHQHASIELLERLAFSPDQQRDALAALQAVARARGNVFEELMTTVKSNSLGQISAARYEVGGEYRRNI